MKKKHTKNTCFLPPYKVTPIVSMLDASQKSSWNITKFHFPDIWKNTRGQGVKLCLIDSGTDFNHEDLKNNIIPGPNLITPSSLPQDDLNHGTFVTGEAVAENNGIGVVGVCPDAKAIIIKALNSSGIGSLQQIAKAIRWAVDNGADIINLSLGCPNETPEIYKAVMYAYNKNVPIFCASGNSGNLKNLYWPANYKEVLSVAAFNQDMHRANFSNVSSNLDFFAPGVDVLSTNLGGDYTLMSGTSMASPIMASIAALMLSYKRNHSTDMKLDSVEDYRDVLKQYCMPISDNCYQKFGWFNTEKFLEWVTIHEAKEN